MSRLYKTQEEYEKDLLDMSKSHKCTCEGLRKQVTDISEAMYKQSQALDEANTRNRELRETIKELRDTNSNYLLIKNKSLRRLKNKLKEFPRENKENNAR